MENRDHLDIYKKNKTIREICFMSKYRYGKVAVVLDLVWEMMIGSNTNLIELCFSFPGFSSMLIKFCFLIKTLKGWLNIYKISFAMAVTITFT